MDPSEETSAGKVPAMAIDDSNQARVVSDESKAPIVEKKKKTKMVRYTQEQIEYCIANPEELRDKKVIKLSELLSKECLAQMGQEQVDWLYAMERAEEEQIVEWKKLQEVLRNERENIYKIPDKPKDVLKQYYAKGYAEYEVAVDDGDVDEDEEVPARVAHPGRRRFRNGIVMRKNQSGGGRILALAMDPSEETSAGKDDLLAIDDSNQDKAKQATVVSDESKAPIIEKKKKKKMVRYTQEQIEYCIAIPEELWDIKVIKLTELLSKECLARMGQEQVDKLYAMERTEEEQITEEATGSLHNERENIYKIPDKPQDVLKQYYAKGYAEYEVVVDDGDVDVDEDDEVPARVAHPGRRRFRNGIVVKKNQSGGGSIRKIN
uniref:Uncharacterized protein n=1 Tax=Oryza barthii TaxID=65489 RepID=A0A0D3H2F5_9ORYZ